MQLGLAARADTGKARPDARTRVEMEIGGVEIRSVWRFLFLLCFT